jgi:hypothetical protein
MILIKEFPEASDMETKLRRFTGKAYKSLGCTVAGISDIMTQVKHSMNWKKTCGCLLAHGFGGCA